MSHKYGETDTGMPIQMDDISVEGGSQEDVLHKMKYMEVKTGKKKEEDISERVKSGNIQ